MMLMKREVIFGTVMLCFVLKENFINYYVSDLVHAIVIMLCVINTILEK